MLIMSSVIVLRWFEKKLSSLRDDWREESTLSHGNPKPGNPLPRPRTGNTHTKPIKRLQQWRTPATPTGGVRGTVAMSHNDCNFI